MDDLKKKAAYPGWSFSSPFTRGYAMGQGNAAVVRIPGGSNSEQGRLNGHGSPAAGSAAGLPEVSGQDVLTGILRDGAQRLLT